MRRNPVIAFCILLISGMLFGLPASAQISATFISPPQAINNLQQVSQLQVNNVGNLKQAFIRLILSNNGQEVYVAEYSDVKVATGMQLLNLAALVPSHKQFGSSTEATLLNSTGRLQFGQYSLCVLISESYIPLSSVDNCIQFEVTPVRPPILVFPVDKSTISTGTPLLNWLPPMPLTSNTTYSLHLTFIDSAQTSTDALMRNPVIYNIDNHPVNSVVYPPTATPLIPGKKYAWQVEAFSGDYPLGITEVWEFTYKAPDKKKKDTVGVSFFRAKTEQDGTFCTAEPVLRVLIPNVKSPQEANFRISDAAGRTVKPYRRKSLTKELKAGDNFFSLNMEEIASFENGKFYFLHVKTDSEKFTIAFLYYSSKEEKEKESK